MSCFYCKKKVAGTVCDECFGQLPSGLSEPLNESALVYRRFRDAARAWLDMSNGKEPPIEELDALKELVNARRAE